MGMIDAALRPLSPGPLHRIARGGLVVEIAPSAGGRVAQITHEGQAWLQAHDEAHAGAIAWGSYPMLPWAGRLRHGSFVFDAREYRLPINLGAHAIHGLGFTLPWHVETHTQDEIVLTLALPADERWPFGGHARQHLVARRDQLIMGLSITADAHAMPVVIGWHPWLRKPERVTFTPEAMYPRDAEGIATPLPGAPTPPPWDDCFVHREPVLIERAGRALRLSSDCAHWVVFDALPEVSCFEPQTGPPDAFNHEPPVLRRGQTRSAWFSWEWL